MTEKKQIAVNIVKKGGCILGGILLALVFALPYLLFREEIQAMGAAGYVGVLISCAISNLSILLPTSSTIIVLSAASVLNPLLCVLMGGIGTAIGEQASYLCGRLGSSGFGNTGDGNQRVNSRVLGWISKNEFLTVFLFAFVPLPVFDVVGIASGARRMSWLKYTAAAVLGKTLKFLLAVVLVYRLLPLAADWLPEYFTAAIDAIRDSLRGKGVS